MPLQNSMEKLIKIALKNLSIERFVVVLYFYYFTTTESTTKLSTTALSTTTVSTTTESATGVSVEVALLPHEAMLITANIAIA